MSKKEEQTKMEVCIDEMSFYWPWIARLVGTAGAFIDMAVSMYLAAKGHLTPEVVELGVPWITFCGVMIGVPPMYDKEHKRKRRLQEDEENHE